MPIVLYQPDIPQNLGAILRLAACMDTPLHIIEPCGFPLDEKRVRRAGMDYIDHVSLTRHASWEAFLDARQGGRIILMTTSGDTSIYDITIATDDWLCFGRESSGAPEEVHRDADIRAMIPMKQGLRSLNLAMSAAIAVSEMRRQQCLD